MYERNSQILLSDDNISEYWGNESHIGLKDVNSHPVWAEITLRYFDTMLLSNLLRLCRKRKV